MSYARYTPAPRRRAETVMFALTSAALAAMLALATSASAGELSAVEYRHEAFNHYFLTTSAEFFDYVIGTCHPLTAVRRYP